MLLTVMIPTMFDRRSPLSRLLNSVLKQPGLNTDFEVLCYQGPGPLGDKINLMIEFALGEYTVVFDDDDWIDGTYMSRVLPALRMGVDAVGYDIAVLVESMFDTVVRHDPIDGSGVTGKHRGLSHKTPVRQSIAAQVPFGNAYTDDLEWIPAVAALVETGAYIPETLYYYDYRNAGPGFVGHWPHDPAEVRWL